MASTDAKTLIAAIRDQSKGKYKVISGGKHLKVIHAEGALKGRSVVDDNGPLIISASPSEARNRELAVHRLMAAEVLKWDPWKGPPRKRDDKPTPQEQQQEQREGRRLAAIEASHRQNNESENLRGILEPFFVKIGGGYSKRGFALEFSRTVYYWLKERGSTYGYQSEQAFYQHIKNLGKGNTIPVNAVMAITEFVNEANAQINPRSWYAHVAGLAKGAKPTKHLPVAIRASEVEGVEEIGIPDIDDLHIESKPSVWDFVGLAAVHERNGLKWSMGLTIDEYAELQRAVGYLEAVCVQHGEKGQKALETLSNFLVKMAEARFYTMMRREEDPDVASD